jgi:hypothetical protein
LIGGKTLTDIFAKKSSP